VLINAARADSGVSNRPFGPSLRYSTMLAA
jgi:hypothetical protein